MKGILQEILNETTIKIVPFEAGESINVECDKYVVQSLKEEFEEETEPTIIVEYDENKKLITGDEDGIF